MTISRQAKGLRGPVPHQARSDSAWRLYVLAMTLLTSCTSHPAEYPIEDACDLAQARLEELGCEEATTPAGTPFAEVCVRAYRDGRDWCATEIAVVQSCEEIEEASRRCEQ